MGSTLRSLILAYKADTKDFRKGSEQVKAEIRSVKDHVGAMDKILAKSFGKTEPIARMRSEIRQLSAAYQQGAISLKAYGDATDRLRDKIGKIQTRRELASNYRGLMVESRESIVARMSGGGAMVGQGGGFGPIKNFGDVGKILKIGGPAAALSGIAYGVSNRIEAIGGGAQSDTLGQFTSMKDAAAGAMRIGSEIKKGFLDGLAGLVIGGGNLLTGGALARYGREDTRAQSDIADRKNAYAVADELRAAKAPLEERKAQEDIKQLLEEQGIEGLKAAAAEAERVRDAKELARLNVAIVNAEQEAAAAAVEKAEAARSYKTALGQTVNDLEKELRISDLMAGGLSEQAARLKDAGGSGEQVSRADFIAKELQARQERESLRRATAENFNETLGEGVSDMFEQAKRQVMEVANFSKRFETPGETFKSNLEEIRRMKESGASPETVRRAMLANAKNLAANDRITSAQAGGAINAAAAAAITRNAAMSLGSAKGIDKLVEIQQKALDLAKENKPLVVNIQEVGI